MQHIAQSRNDAMYTPSVVRISPVDSGSGKGFIRYPGNLTGIGIDLRKPTGSPPPPYHFYFIVDPDRQMIVDRISWMDMSDPDEVYIPAGAAWYDRMGDMTINETLAVPNLNFEASYSPADARVYQLFVNRYGLDALRNASAQIPLQDVNVSGYGYDFNGTYNGTSPAGAGWSGKVEWRNYVRGNVSIISTWPPPPEDPNKVFYLVLINGESDRAINLTIRGRMGAYYA